MHKDHRLELTIGSMILKEQCLALVFVQFVLGVLTLIMHVPIALGVLHQVVAFFLLSAYTFTLHRFSK